MAPHGDGLVLRTIDWLTLNLFLSRDNCSSPDLSHWLSSTENLKKRQELEDMCVRHELFEKRWPIYEATMKFVAHGL